MIIVRIFGGLGNQLFQYAAAKSLATHHKTELKFDVGNFENYKLRNFDLAKLALPLSIASPEEVSGLKAITVFQRVKARLTAYPSKTFYKEPFFHFDAHFFRLSDNVYLQGYFQSEKYFLPIRDTLREEFMLSHLMPESPTKIGRRLTEENSVSIHIRKGDYKNSEAEKIHGVLPVGYYREAVSLMKEKHPDTRFYLFSDDPVNASRELSLPNVTIISERVTKTHFEDLCLMSHCRHNIIANSSFSWWAAWLNNNPEKTVIAPKNWFNNGPKDTQDLLPDSWIKL